ncbi:MAG: GNAT family N-acetyltransferase [Oceanospirillaceae bacterium]|nr:GNAT family N-acetyltransferase [Oceanospirillaceae bacterium]
MKSLIFCQVRTKIYLGVDTSGFVVLDALSITIRHSLLLIGHFGLLGYLRQVLKSISHHRILYLIQWQGKVVSCGTITIGFCKYYQVELTAAVIGSVWTDESHRGLGLAHLGIRAVVNYLLARGIHSFYIDTQETNFPMLKAIKNTNFGEPVGYF